MVFEYWTFGNADAVLQLLNAVAAITTNASGIVGLAKTLALFGFLVYVIASVMKADPRGMATWFVALVFGWYILFVPRVEMVVYDHSSGGAAAARTVGNVPLGLGFIASASSQIGRWLTEKAELVFSLPDQANFINGGFLAPHRMSLATLGYTMTNERLAADWMNFMRDCTWYDINIYNKRYGYSWALSADEYKNTANPLESLGKTNRALFVHIVTDGPAVHSCMDAYNILRTATEAEAQSPEAQRRYARLAFPGMPEAQAVNAFQDALSDAQLLLYGAPIATHQLIQNRWVHNLMRSEATRNAISSGNTALAMVEFGAIQAEQARLNAYVQSARAAHDTVPAIRNVLEAIIIGLFPVILLLTILLGLQGLRLFMEYGTFFLSLQLWGFCYALMNYFLISKTSNNVYGIANSNGAGDISLSTLGMVAEEVTADMAMAGQMVWAIPLICYALTRGSVAMGLSAMAARAAAPAQSGAEQTGQQTGTGNVRSGEGRFATVNAPNTVSVGSAAGTSTFFMGSSGSNVGTQPMVSFQGNESRAPMGLSTQQTNSAALSATASAVARDGQQWSTRASETRQAAQSEMVGAALRASDTSSIDSSWQASGAGSFTRGQEATQSIASSIMSSTGANQKVATEMMMKAGLGTPSGLSPATLRAEIGKKFGAEAQAKFEQDSKGTDQQTYKDASQFVQTMTASQSARHAVMGGSEQSKGVDAKLSTAQNLETGAQRAFETSRSLEQQAQSVASGQTSLSIDLAKASPEIAQRMSTIAQDPNFRGAMARGDTEGAVVYMSNQLGQSLQGSPGSLSQVMDTVGLKPSAAPSLASGPGGGPAPTAASLQADYQAGSQALAAQGQQAISQQWSERPQVDVGRPDTSSVQNIVGSGMAAAQSSVDGAQASVNAGQASQQQAVQPNLPNMGPHGLDVPQSQVRQVASSARNDLGNTAKGVVGAIDSLASRMGGGSTEAAPTEQRPDSMAYVNQLRAEQGLPPLEPPKDSLVERIPK